MVKARGAKPYELLAILVPGQAVGQRDRLVAKLARGEPLLPLLAARAIRVSPIARNHPNSLLFDLRVALTPSSPASAGSRRAKMLDQR